MSIASYINRYQATIICLILLIYLSEYSHWVSRVFNDLLVLYFIVDQNIILSSMVEQTSTFNSSFSLLEILLNFCLIHDIAVFLLSGLTAVFWYSPINNYFFLSSCFFASHYVYFIIYWFPLFFSDPIFNLINFNVSSFYSHFVRFRYFSLVV